MSEAREPVRRIPSDPESYAPEPGIGLCLSGGGYRAMLFHAGALWRLDELGWLPRLDRISSVSGGSITAAVLGLAWGQLGFDDYGRSAHFRDRVVEPLRELASTTIDWKAVLSGLVWPGGISGRVARAYDTHLFGGATLQDLPESPRFIINATNLGSGALWRFSRDSMADYRVGRVDHPRLRLALAVAASSAFPPILSPARIALDARTVVTEPGNDLADPAYRHQAVLADGGVYDNLGLETVWKRLQTVLVSDAGGKMAPHPEPHTDWVRQSLRVAEIIDNQVRSLRKRQLIASLASGRRGGAYWGIRSDIRKYPAPDLLECPESRTLELAATPTRLARLASTRQERLINWGYAICDAGIRAHVQPGAEAPSGFPFPDSAV